jgi:hypothetical protein
MYQVHNPKIPTIKLLTFFNFSLLPKPWSGSFPLCGVAKGKYLHRKLLFWPSTLICRNPDDPLYLTNSSQNRHQQEQKYFCCDCGRNGLHITD